MKEFYVRLRFRKLYHAIRWVAVIPNGADEPLYWVYETVCGTVKPRTWWGKEHFFSGPGGTWEVPSDLNPMCSKPGDVQGVTCDRCKRRANG